MNIYDEIKYTVIDDSDSAVRTQADWNMAFGLQAVDGLRPSEYMVSLAKSNIKGEITYEQIEGQLRSYYSSDKKSITTQNEREADEVSLRIVQILNDGAFSFSPLTLKNYHKRLFYGIDLGISGKYIGNFRDVNISKSEPILNGKSVTYADHRLIEQTLKYDFDEEQGQNYVGMTENERVDRITTFTSRIWQVHPFREGNTRTTAVFVEKYLRSIGFEVDNDLFKDNSVYFRNALVRANYRSVKDGVNINTDYLKAFFENLIAAKCNTLDNRSLYVTTDSRNYDGLIIPQNNGRK